MRKQLEFKTWSWSDQFQEHEFWRLIRTTRLPWNRLNRIWYREFIEVLTYSYSYAVLLHVCFYTQLTQHEHTMRIMTCTHWRRQAPCPLDMYWRNYQLHDTSSPWIGHIYSICQHASAFLSIAGRIDAHTDLQHSTRTNQFGQTQYFKSKEHV